MVLVSWDVINADQHHGNRGAEAVQVAVFQAPQHVLGVIAADAQIQRVTGRVILGPHRFAVAFPALRDGIAHKNQPGRGAVLFDALVQR